MTGRRYILAREYLYNRSCYREISRKLEETFLIISEAYKAFHGLTTVLEKKMISGCEVLRMADVSRLYSEVTARLFCKGDQISLPTTQRLKEKIRKFFGIKHGFGVPKHASEHDLFNNSVEKWLLVEVAIMAKRAKYK